MNECTRNEYVPENVLAAAAAFLRKWNSVAARNSP